MEERTNKNCKKSTNPSRKSNQTGKRNGLRLENQNRDNKENTK